MIPDKELSKLADDLYKRRHLLYKHIERCRWDDNEGRAHLEAQVSQITLDRLLIRLELQYRRYLANSENAATVFEQMIKEYRT